MKTANIAMAKNQLSRLLEQVKQGETIVITDRNRPVARLSPLLAEDAAVAALQADGQLSPPLGRLDLAAFQTMSAADLAPGESLARAIIDEREEGR